MPDREGNVEYGVPDGAYSEADRPGSGPGRGPGVFGSPPARVCRGGPGMVSPIPLEGNRNGKHKRIRPTRRTYG